VIFIVVRFDVKDEYVDGWLERVRPFTEAVRAEPGNLWFDWSRSVDDPNQFVLLEAFADADAGTAHVQSDHFVQALKDMKPAIAKTPSIISQTVDADGWSEMGELKV
jgi:quinol monooxygenase YgiN